MLSKQVEFDFGEHWLDEDVISKSKTKRTGISREVSLEVSPIYAGESQPADTPVVRLLWRPETRSVAFAWPKDLAALQKSRTKGLVQWHRHSVESLPTAVGQERPVTILDRGTFLDAESSHSGVTTRLSGRMSRQDVLVYVRTRLQSEVEKGHENREVVGEVIRALDAFPVTVFTRS